MQFASRARADLRMMSLNFTEINIDGLIGPTHHESDQASAFPVLERKHGEWRRAEGRLV